jgi:hypothetical protein
MAGMKKANSRNPRAASKSKIAPKNVDEYLAGIPEPARSTFNKMRAAIRSAVPPQAAEIIRYRIPAFKDKRVLVWFAAFSKHCSLFPTAAIIEAFKRTNLRASRHPKGRSTYPRTSHCRLCWCW